MLGRTICIGVPSTSTNAVRSTSCRAMTRRSAASTAPGVTGPSSDQRTATFSAGVPGSSASSSQNRVCAREAG